MGINFVIACHRCREQHYMMRGEEPADLQEFYRRHKVCFSPGVVDIFADCNMLPGYTDPWSDAWVERRLAETKP